MHHTILFSGHMIDKPGQPARFPADKEQEAAAAIRQALKKIRDTTMSEPLSAAGPDTISAIAAAACGGDILFHEACRDLNIPSDIYLAIPIDAFQQTSVSPCGHEWEQRYRALVQQLPVHILLPEATVDIDDIIWEKADRWMLQSATTAGQMTLIVLWDGHSGGNPGGTDYMVSAARERHANIEIIDVNHL